MIQFEKHSGMYTLFVQQALPIGLDEAWHFFTQPGNLKKITPPHMGFDITSSNLEPIYAGQVITYKVSPIAGIKTNWITEITHVNDRKYFVDEQRFGPYSMWHHEHIFEETKDGVLMTDRVSYKIPFGPLGSIAQKLFIKKQLQSIFTFREQVLNSFFPQKIEQPLQSIT
jgi:ligand-binding SRPBCC domain-containing protein